MEGVKESLWNMTWLDNWSLDSVLPDVMYLFKNWREQEKKKWETSPSQLYALNSHHNTSLSFNQMTNIVVPANPTTIMHSTIHFTFIFAFGI